MGNHLVEIAAELGMEVYVTSRSRGGSVGVINYICGNARDEGFLEKLLVQKWDAIVDFMVYKTVDFQRRVTRFLDATDQYFYLSSARVYADSEKPITEDSPRLLDVSLDKDFLATDEYALAKARQENILRASGRRNWTIIRPYITYARERLQLGVLEKEGWLYRALQGRSIVFSRDINERMTTMTNGEDVARALVALIGKTDALAEVFHITTLQAHRWGSILDIYLGVLKQHLNIRPSVCLVGMEDFLRCHLGEHQVIYDRAFDRVFDNSKIARFVNVEEFVPVEVGLREALDAFLTKPVFKGINWRDEAKKDRLSLEHSSLGEATNLKDKARYVLHRYFRN